MTSTITRIFITSHTNDLLNAHSSASSTLSLGSTLNARRYTSMKPPLRTLSWDRTPTRRGPLSISRRQHFISMLGRSIDLPSLGLRSLYCFCPLKQEGVGLAPDRSGREANPTPSPSIQYLCRSKWGTTSFLSSSNAHSEDDCDYAQPRWQIYEITTVQPRTTMLNVCRVRLQIVPVFKEPPL